MVAMAKGEISLVPVSVPVLGCYALLDAPTDLATSTVQPHAAWPPLAIRTFAHNSIAATVQGDPTGCPACAWHRTEVRGLGTGGDEQQDK